MTKHVTNKCCKMTNGDKFRAMTNDEIANYMCVNHMCDYCPAESEKCDSLAIDSEQRCYASWVEYLNEAKEV